MEPCWLCTFSHTADAKTLATFISEHIGSVSVSNIAAQVSADLRERFPDAEGADCEACARHIECHTLSPTCKLASMLRSLLVLSDDLAQNMRKFDDEGHLMLDPKLVEMYLKVQSQIMTIYRTSEPNKLLFAERNI